MYFMITKDLTSNHADLEVQRWFLEVNYSQTSLNRSPAYYQIIIKYPHYQIIIKYPHYQIIIKYPHYQIIIKYPHNQIIIKYPNQIIIK